MWHKLTSLFLSNKICNNVYSNDQINLISSKRIHVHVSVIEQMISGVLFIYFKFSHFTECLSILAIDNDWSNKITLRHFFSPNNPVLFDRYYLRISLRLIKMGSVDEMIINGLILVNLPVVVNHLELVLAFWMKQKNISVWRVYIITCRSKEISTLLLVMFFNILSNFFFGGGAFGRKEWYRFYKL